MQDLSTRYFFKKSVMTLSAVCASLVLFSTVPAEAKGPVTAAAEQVVSVQKTSLTEERINAVLKCRFGTAKPTRNKPDFPEDNLGE